MPQTVIRWMSGKMSEEQLTLSAAAAGRITIGGDLNSGSTETADYGFEN
jgi:hypothetical protein